ncbi:Dehydrogenase/reductase SDR family member 7 [Folsomia candida]|uniref:Dehydrogenase/reductase SDR family member 7 n=1 Tax=Folsomia candida TaxID=158441 RepID=A0A226ENZ8_FOLCA|nr:Dehydrogenase/reductase SDR family member 7 [Folsomia candida]
MDLCSVLCVLLIVFFSVCLAIICLSDSDIITFLSCYLGKQPGITKELSKCEGSKIVISARREDELKRVKADCLAANPSRNQNSILILPLDMTNYASHEPALKKVLQTFGKLDVLVSNAGRSQRAKWHEIEQEVDKQLFDLNVFSLVNMNRIVLRHFFEAGKGHLAVISSIAGKIGAPNSGSYTGSKFALHGYFESLRNEIRNRNIGITMICPGPVFSSVLKEAFTSKINQKVDQDHSPSDKRMTPERCGFLSLVAIGNQLEESWCSPFPIIFLTYLSAYQPYIFSKLSQLMHSTGYFTKLRDNKNITELTNKEN